MRKIFIIPTIIFIILTAPLIQAGVFKISNRNYGNYSAFQAELDSIFDSLENEVNALLPSSAATPYLTGVANATVLAGSGLGTDYTSKFTYVNLGFQVGGAADLGSNSVGSMMNGSLKPEQMGGFSAQTGFVIGAIPGNLGVPKLGFFDPKLLKVFLYYFGQSYNFSDVDVSFQTMGLLGQYNIVPEKIWNWTSSWTGVSVMTGLRTIKARLMMSENINESTITTVNIPAPTQVTASFNGTANIGADINMTSIPVEVATGVKFLVFGFYGGVGTDINYGSVSSIASISGPVEMSANPVISGVSGTASLDLGETGSPGALTWRYFMGTSLNLGVAGAFVQYNRSLSNNTIGLTGGFRFYF